MIRFFIKKTNIERKAKSLLESYLDAFQQNQNLLLFVKMYLFLGLMWFTILRDYIYTYMPRYNVHENNFWVPKF